MLIRAFFIMFVLAACVPNKYDNLPHDSLIDHKQCKSFGFEEGSFEYENCIEKLKEQRDEDQEV